MKTKRHMMVWLSFFPLVLFALSVILKYSWAGNYDFVGLITGVEKKKSVKEYMNVIGTIKLQGRLGGASSIRIAWIDITDKTAIRDGINRYINTMEPFRRGDGVEVLFRPGADLKKYPVQAFADQISIVRVGQASSAGSSTSEGSSKSKDKSKDKKAKSKK